VYPTPPTQPGTTQTPPTIGQVDSGGGSAGERAQSPEQLEQPAGEGAPADEGESSPASSDDVGAVSGDEASKLPFTGYSAMLLLFLGVGAVLTSAILRALARRAEHA
jgi:hypothetical protein